MRLAAIYIPNKSLSHVFGKDHIGQTLNLGGKFIYSFIESNENIEMKRDINNKFIEGFWGTNLSIVTAIVGRNAVGKTSILRAMSLPIDPKHRNFVYIYELDEDESLLSIFNETQKDILNDTTAQLNPLTHNPFETQYFSPVLDYDLKESFSSIALINYFDDSLEEYYLNSLIRNVFLLNDPILKIIKEVYSDFPSYDKYIIRAKKHKKSFFTRLYADANFANPNTGDVLKNHLEGDLQRLQEETKHFRINREALIEMYKDQIKMLERESFNSLFRKLWDLDEYKYQDDQDNIHSANQILKDFEVNILSYLILGAVFPQTGLGGGFDFDKILKTENFISRLNMFLELYLVNEYKDLYQKIKTDIGSINVDDFEKILNIINNDRWNKYGGIDVEPVRKRMRNDLNKFYNILEFYNYLQSIIKNGTVTIYEGNLEFNIIENEISIFEEFISKYKKLLESFKGTLSTVTLLEFLPDKQLSTGEKSIIDFYASLNNYLDQNINNLHTNYQNYMLLLDEPELGYHPLWKKKFIQAIVKTLPILFTKITPKVFDKQSNSYINTDRENPIVQIIFSTHDPLTLSDIPQTNIIYLNKNNENNSYISNDGQKSFAANITDLLADSFFIEEGLIGDFAKEKINYTISWLNNREDRTNSEYHKKLIENIDEPIIKRKLAEMFSEKMHDSLAKDILLKEIESLQQRYNKM